LRRLRADCRQCVGVDAVLALVADSECRIDAPLVRVVDAGLGVALDTGLLDGRVIDVEEVAVRLAEGERRLPGKLRADEISLARAREEFAEVVADLVPSRLLSRACCDGGPNQFRVAAGDDPLRVPRQCDATLVVRVDAVALVGEPCALGGRGDGVGVERAEIDRGIAHGDELVCRGVSLDVLGVVGVERLSDNRRREPQLFEERGVEDDGEERLNHRFQRERLCLALVVVPAVVLRVAGEKFEKGGDVQSRHEDRPVVPQERVVGRDPVGIVRYCCRLHPAAPEASGYPCPGNPRERDCRCRCLQESPSMHSQPFVPVSISHSVILFGRTHTDPSGDLDIGASAGLSASEI